MTLNGTGLWLEDTGPTASGETVVFSHGLLFSTALFGPQVAALRGDHRCVAYDHRGQGRSEDSDLPSIPMELLYQDAVALIETLGVGPVHFVGLSMGGFVGMRIAARRPDLLRSLVLLETSAEREPHENILRYGAMNVVARTLGTRPLLGRLLPILFGRSTLADPSRRADVARWASGLQQNRRGIWRAVNGVIDRVAILPELGRVRCPTLVMVGEEDVATVPARAETIHRAIAGSRLVRIPRAGHSSSLEQPEVVTAAVRGFVAEHGSSTAR